MLPEGFADISWHPTCRLSRQERTIQITAWRQSRQDNLGLPRMPAVFSVEVAYLDDPEDEETDRSSEGSAWLCRKLHTKAEPLGSPDRKPLEKSKALRRPCRKLQM